MLKIRVIPCLLLKGDALVKTVKFKDPVYIGDAMNAVRIFNTKGAAEIILLDILATKEKRSFPLELISRVAEECFVPFSVGGGITTIEGIGQVLSAGAEKVVINTAALEDPGFVETAAKKFGSQSIVVSIDVKLHEHGGYEVFFRGGTHPARHDPVDWARKMAASGAGEIFLNAIDQDGGMSGYDLRLIRLVADSVSIPVIACGGAGRMEDFAKAVFEGHASAVSAGSLFVFHGRRRAVLINYPAQETLNNLFAEAETLYKLGRKI